MEYGYQDLDQVTKVCHLLNGNRCDKLFIAIVIVKAHPDKYEKDFGAVVAFLMQQPQSRSAKWQKISLACDTFKGKIELKKYFMKDYDSVPILKQH